MNPLRRVQARDRRRRRRAAGVAVALAAASVAPLATRSADRARAVQTLERAADRSTVALRDAVDLHLFEARALPRLEGAEAALIAAADPAPLALGFEAELAERLARAARATDESIERGDPELLVRAGVTLHATPVDVRARIPAAALDEAMRALAEGPRRGLVTRLRVRRPDDSLTLELTARVHYLHATDRTPISTR